MKKLLTFFRDMITPMNLIGIVCLENNEVSMYIGTNSRDLKIVDFIPDIIQIHRDRGISCFLDYRIDINDIDPFNCKLPAFTSETFHYYSTAIIQDDMSITNIMAQHKKYFCDFITKAWKNYEIKKYVWLSSIEQRKYEITTLLSEISIPSDDELKSFFDNVIMLQFCINCMIKYEESNSCRLDKTSIKSINRFEAECTKLATRLLTNYINTEYADILVYFMNKSFAIDNDMHEHKNRVVIIESRKSMLKYRKSDPDFIYLLKEVDTYEEMWLSITTTDQTKKEYSKYFKSVRNQIYMVKLLLDKHELISDDLKKNLVEQRSIIRKISKEYELPDYSWIYNLI